MPKPIPHPFDPFDAPHTASPTVSPTVSPAAGGPGILERLRLPGALFAYAWTPFRFAAAHALVAAAPFADLLGADDLFGADPLTRWAHALDPRTIPDPRPTEDERAA